MGEVFLGRVEGTDEELVVKRILPHLTENPRFLRLFLDETRIASRLVHPNIARIVELGEAEGTWFVAMEHVVGKDLRELLKRSREQGHHVPLEVVVHVGIEVAKGLSYAHHATDSQGRHLRIVHRDVSPHNILIGRAGVVKVIDFGVAKAANKSIHTATGVLKGKFPYMSPEQAQAHPVDPRTDVFALGIVLWEALCARYLFRGKTDAATLKMVREAMVPAPSTLRDDVPEGLDAVLLKALRREQKDRYQTVDAFREALENVAANLPPADIAKWMVEYDDVVGFEEEEPDSDEVPVRPSRSVAETQAESREEETVVDAPAPVRARAKVQTESSEEDRERVKKLLAQVAGRPTNIGPQATSFVGRVAELADLHQLFRQGARLITLLGPGGTGKTRLSMQFGSQLVTWFQQEAEGVKRGGVWFCDLTEATDIESIAAAVARALGFPLAPGDPIRQVGHAIAARNETLLVLDNFEQVAAHAPATIGAWLKAAPKARFVVSSRELLRVDEEHVFEVPPLRVPKPNEQARGAEAVQLFVERARAVRPGWEPDEAELVAIAELVRQLDGMPLAIELAAGRVGVLSPTQLVQRLPQRFSLLVNRRGAVERQATLRGAIDWSWKSLTGDEGATLAQLSVFRGGFTAAAVEAVVQTPGGADAVSVLMSLRSKSLVRVYFPTGDEANSRFGLFETIREYALEKLAEQGDGGVRDRHASYYLALGRRLAAGAEGSKRQLDELELERENLLDVHRRALDADDVAGEGLSSLMALDPLLTIRGPIALHLQMLDTVVERIDSGIARITALEARGRARLARGRLAEGEDDLLDADAIAENLELERIRARLRYLLGTAARLQGRKGEAATRLEESIELLSASGDVLTHARALSAYAALQQEQGQSSRALETYNEALELHRKVGDRRYEGITLANLGVQQQSLGLLKQARTNYQAALAIHRELGNRRSEGICRLNLGDLAAELEQPGPALAHYESALEIVREVGARRFEGLVSFSLGALHLQYGEYEDADRRISDAIEVTNEVGDQRHLGLSLAIKAATIALQGQVEEAETFIAEGARVLHDAGDATYLDALDLYRGHLELARSLQTASNSQGMVLRQRVDKRITHAESPGAADAQSPSGTASPADRSEHVRAALRSLRGALSDHDQAPAVDNE